MRGAKDKLARQSRRRPSSGCRHLLPVNGAKDAVINGFANRQRCRDGTEVATSPFSPFTGRRCRQADEGRRRVRNEG
ncbi:MAG: hypothetical protein EOR97_29850 [Mesorhizobium sp.]|nr:MAG: hypothetical protein EOR97_29850 [Mesorhizobium sp.]